MLKKIFLFIVLTSILACSSDDDSSSNALNCSQDDWTGTYNGTITCDGGTTQEQVVVTFTAFATNQVIYSASNSSSVFQEPFTPLEGCAIVYSGSDSAGNSASVAATLTNGTLALTETVTIGTSITICEISATKD